MNILNAFKWRKDIVLSATFVLILSAFIVSCKKQRSNLGADVIDQNELLNSGGIDTFTLITYTEYTDSILSDNPRFGLLGIYNDPEFGIFDASIYTQVKLSGTSPNFENIADIVVDSFILALEFAQTYGTPANQTFEVYELDEEMSLDSNYYTDDELALKSGNWVNPGSETIFVNPLAITVVGNDTVATQVRIPLIPAKGMQIINDSQIFTSEFANNDLFVKNYLKGIHIKTDGNVPGSGNGVIGYYNMVDQDTKLTIYYTDNSTGAKKSFDLSINATCADYNHFNINNSGKRIDQVVNNHALGQEEFYAQSGKSRAVIEVPSIADLPSNIVIHNAVLRLPVEYLFNSNYAPSAEITVLTKNGLKLVKTGVYNSGTREYLIDMRSHIQEYAAGSTDELSFYISPSYFVSASERIIFNGQNSTNKKKPRLVVSYTEF